MKKLPELLTVLALTLGFCTQVRAAELPTIEVGLPEDGMFGLGGQYMIDKGIDKKAVLGQNMDFDTSPPPQFNYRSGDILLPQVKFIEPLRTESEHFLDCIRNGKVPLTGVHHARKVVEILERARSYTGANATA